MRTIQTFVLAVSVTAALAAASVWIKLPRTTFERAALAPSAPSRLEVAAGGLPETDPPPTAAARQSSRAAKGPAVIHAPQQPKSGQPVVVSIDFRGQPSPAAALTLEYQVVDPGKYISLADPSYQKQWARLAMNDAAENGDKTAGDHIFSVEMPASLQKHRRLVRYRIRLDGANKYLAPVEGDSQPNFAYFVYDGVPAWKGAINPKSGDPRFRQPVTYASEVLERVAVYHLISSRPSVVKATWRDNQPPDRHAYKYTGTIVYDGVVYDHVGFRARGGSWRHAMGKNMWKFNFRPGHRFAARDSYQQPYKTKWDKLNLGACIQQGDYGMRGEQGMFEAVGFALFNLAGEEAPRTHWVHLRIIDGPEETPANQYEGDFWGLYLAVENLDEHFLKEHALPPGNLYKMEFGAKTAFNGDPAISNQSDVNGFMAALARRQQPAAWWTSNVDLNRYFNYRAILECIHHYDIDSGKNYFYYRNPESKQWIVLPWDIDLSWGEHMYGGGYEPFFAAGVLNRAPFKQQYQQRLAEIRDLLFNSEQMDKMLTEFAGFIDDPKGGPSLAKADRAKWDYNPVMTSEYVQDSKAGEGKFYFGNPKNTFESMMKYMKGYVSKRSAWIDSRLLAGYRPPELPVITPVVVETGAPAYRMDGPATAKGCQWRLAEVTDPKSPVFDSRQPWKYEIQTVWEQKANLSDPVTPPAKLLSPGHTYRLRVRYEDAGGIWSRWSAPTQFVAAAETRVN